jgi:murein DD-endopeptidase MepM/ murein hydrolase activator NlpD
MRWQKRRNLDVEQERRPRLRLLVVLATLVTSVLVARSWVVLEQPPSQAVVHPSGSLDRFAEKKTYRDNLRTLTHQIREGDTLYQVLVSHGVKPQEVSDLAAACKTYRDLQSLRAGERLELVFQKHPQSLERLRFQEMDWRMIVLGRTPWGWAASSYKEPMIVTTDLVHGTINESLYQSAQDDGIDFDLAMALADIFAWDIDFFVDLRPGDQYAFIYEKRFRDGEFVGSGRILVARFDNAGTRHQAYYYQVPGKEGDYFDAEGNSLRKQFLKSPLRYTRISSGFSKRRLHPILKIYRPHLGIDYAAPTGTPVVALGNGRIIFKGWKNGFGRYLEIRHNQRYTTTYGHLSHFGRGLKVGATVQQGQLIGNVGATGLATGPHLDFRFKEDGRFVNPLQVRFPPAEPVPSAYLAAFRERVAELEGDLVHALARSATEEGDRSPILAASGRQ